MNAQGFEHRPRLYSAAQVRELDRRAIAELGVPGYVLMQRAACAAYGAMRVRWPDAHRVAVLCGPGNNGGDGYEIARLARADGLTVDLLQVGPIATTGDAVTARQAWLDSGGEVREWSANAVLSAADVVVDAIFGIGITRDVVGDARAAIEAVNARRPDQRVLAIDVPSGLDSDRGVVHGAAIRADLTVSFIGRKQGLYTAQGPDHAGDRAFDALGLEPSFLQSATHASQLLDAEDLRAALPRRRRSAHKGQHGHVLLVGGERGMAGAILLAARAALRAGAGLITVATRAEHAAALTAAQPEVMVRGVERAADLSFLMRQADVLAMGPGLGTGSWGQALWQASLDFSGPLLMDADALNLLAAGPVKTCASHLVLTPHPGEAARLLGTSIASVQSDRFAAVRDLSERFAAVTVLKGVGSLVCGSGIAICPYGNPGMGVGGMGDVLTGVAAAFLAQGLAPETAVQSAVLVHALAGDRAATRGERGLSPSDLIDRKSVV
jgi:NAD(P)H-hydrate epimerase